MVGASSRGGGEAFRAVLTGSEACPAFCSVRTGLSGEGGVKWLERGTDHSLPLNAGLRLDSSYMSAILCACIGVSRGDHYLVRKRNWEVME